MKLVVVEEGSKSHLEFERPLIRIGRAIDNDIRLAHPNASRHHCQIEIDERGAWVVDLGSSNGTQVNGEAVQRRLLRRGDVVVAGGARLLVEEGAEAAEEVQEVTALLTPAPAPEVPDVGFSTLSDDAGHERENLRVFARITRALALETEEAPLLRLIVDSAVALVGGERAFLLLGGRPGEARGTLDPAEMTVRIARSFDHADIPIPASRLSMGIARRVLESGRPLLSVDAGRDDRFSGMASVEDLRLRSVLCLPVSIDGRIEGVLYVDNRLQRGAFGEDDLDQAELFASMAAIAIRNARLVAELRARNQRLLQSSEQIRSLNEQLGRKVRDRDSELAVVRAELGRARGRYDYTAIVGASDEMRRVFQELDRIVETELPVLIEGESGTGKELIARAIHFNGPRKEKPFVVENCAALPDTLLESELFGHTRGAFTGAERAKKGLIEQAHGGTLFLDEIGDMSSEMQKKLLRVLQEGELRPLGSNQQVQVDVRLLAASNRDLKDLVQRGGFREDLFYRINVLSLRLPPLRERRDDIPLLAEALLTRAAREVGRPVPVLLHEVQAALAANDWPGNVRELENEMRRVLILAGETVGLEHLSPAITQNSGLRAALTPADGLVAIGDLRAAVASFERRAIEEALARATGNKSRAAKELGISRFALQRKLDKYGLSRGDEEDLEPEGEDPDDAHEDL
jgi:transcriptional regulator with GAF, ATPase, and Fis domain